MDLLESSEKIIRAYYKNDNSFTVSWSLLKNFYKTENVNSIKMILENTDKLIKNLNENDKAPASKKHTFYLLSIVFKKNAVAHKKFYSNYVRIRDNIKAEVEKNLPINAKEEQCLSVTLKQLRKKKINHDDLTQKTLLYNLLVFSDYTPRLDYYILKWNPENKEGNYMYLDNKTIRVVINKYKTSKAYHEWKFSLKGTLNKYVKNYVKWKKIKPDDFLFLNRSKKPFPSNKFSEHIQSTFKQKIGHKININCLRKIKEIHLFHRNKKTWGMSYKEKNDYVVEHSRHNLKTSELYYNKLLKKEQRKNVKIKVKKKKS